MESQDWHIVQISGKYVALINGEWELVTDIGKAFKFSNAESACKSILAKIKILRFHS